MVDFLSRNIKLETDGRRECAATRLLHLPPTEAITVRVIIREYVSSDDLGPCVPVMRILRQHLDPDDVIVAARLRRQITQGYRLMALIQNDRPVALIGFRPMENLVFGHFLYVDDLVVATDDRGKGHATQLLAAVRDIAHETGQDLVVLDTALSNETALRLYQKNGFERVAYRLINRLPR